MLAQFTDRARKVMALANQNAQRLNAAYITPEHILIGILEDGGGTAIGLFKARGIALLQLKRDLEPSREQTIADDYAANHGNAKHAKNVIVFALEESKAIGNSQIGTEHYVLGMLHSSETCASQLLLRSGIEPGSFRRAIKVREILIRYWDPSNVIDRPEAHGSYDVYVYPLLKLIESEANEDAVAHFLHERESETMCFPSLGTQRLRTVAKKLLAIRDG